MAAEMNKITVEYTCDTCSDAFDLEFDNVMDIDSDPEHEGCEPECGECGCTCADCTCDQEECDDCGCGEDEPDEE